MGYTEERFDFVARQRAPLIEVTGFVLSDTSDDGKTTSTLSCGHSYSSAPHFSQKIGDKKRCFECGKVIAASLPEFME